MSHKLYKHTSVKLHDFQNHLNNFSENGWILHSWNVMKDFAEEIIVLIVWEK